MIDKKERNKRKVWNKVKKGFLNAEDWGARFVEDVIAITGISTSTFYEYFPSGSEQSELIHDKLYELRSKDKIYLREEFKKSLASQERIFAYKLMATKEEREAWSGYRPDEKDNDSDKPKLLPLDDDEDDEDDES